MFVDKTLEQMQDQVEFDRASFTELEWLADLDSKTCKPGQSFHVAETRTDISLNHSGQAMRDLTHAAFIRHREQYKHLSDWFFGSYAPSEELSNAVEWGNGGEKKPIVLEAYVGNVGTITGITDSGPGWDWQTHVRKLREGKYNSSRIAEKDRNTPSGGGCGTSSMMESIFETNYANGGRTVYIVVDELAIAKIAETKAKDDARSKTWGGQL